MTRNIGTRELERLGTRLARMRENGMTEFRYSLREGATPDSETISKALNDALDKIEVGDVKEFSFETPLAL